MHILDLRALVREQRLDVRGPGLKRVGARLKTGHALIQARDNLGLAVQLALEISPQRVQILLDFGTEGFNVRRHNVVGPLGPSALEVGLRLGPELDLDDTCGGHTKQGAAT